MSLVASFDVNGLHIQLLRVPPKLMPFYGQKMLHLFEMGTVSPESKKSCYVPEFTSQQAENALEEPAGIFIKLDGSCGMLVRSHNIWTLFTRIDLSLRKKSENVWNHISISG
jgi:hypothetical protein